MVLSFVGNYVAAFATFPYLTRVLGPTHFGMLAYATAITMYGTLLTEWGMNLSGPRAVVACRDDPSRINELIWSVIGAKTLLCIAATLVLSALLAFNVGGAEAHPVIWLTWLSVLSSVCTLYWLFQGLENFKLIAWMIFVNRGVTLPLTFWLVKSQQDLMTAAAIQAAGPVIAGVFSIIIASRMGLLRGPVISWRAIMMRLTEGADMFVATASVTMFGAANAIVLTSYSGSYAAGIYAGADKIRTVCALVPAQLSSVLYPRISVMFKRQKREAARLTVYGAALTLLISLCGAGISFVFADSITSIVLGKQFGGAADVLRILALSTVFGNLAYFLGLQVLVPSGASKLRSAMIFVTGCLNVTFALLLVRHHGAIGAATSFLVCEALLLAVYVGLVMARPRLRRYLSLWSAGQRRFADAKETKRD